LVENDLTFDYLIIQDGNSFMHLPWIQQQILAEEGKFEDGKKPGELIWTKFTGDKNVLVVGSAALDVLEARDQFISDEPIADFYEYYRTIHIQRKATKDKKEIARLQAILDQLPRVLDDKNERFLEWQNNVEVIPDMAVAVSNVFQNDDFTTLSKALRLSAVSVCKSRNLPLTAVVTSSFIYKDGCMEPSAYLAAVNKRDYALRHNYAFVARSLEFAQQELRPVKRRTVWGKVDVLEKVLPKYDWVFWMDMDAVIMNMDQSVHSILDGLRKKYPKGAAAFESTVDLVVVKPGRDKMLNAGVLLLRNSEWSRQFIRQVQNTESWYNKSPSYEQGAMWEVMSNPIHQEHIIVLEDNHVFNTFPQFYQPGDFVVHFAPDKCPSPAVLKGLKAAERIESGQVITSLDES
jgi:hypothetical protein